MSGNVRRPPIFGPESWMTVADAEWSHWDWWFALIAVAEFDGDLDALQRELVTRLRPSWSDRHSVEAKLSHLADLRTRLRTTGLDVAVLASGAQPDKPMLAKARRKVLGQALEDRAMTNAMREPPRVRLDRRARYDHWDRFPMNPAHWYEKLAGRRPAANVQKGRTFTITRQLRERLACYDSPNRGNADRLALYRAFHTVGVELAERGDDSYGNIGELRLDAFETYLSVDWQAAGMAAEAWWQDLCELLVSEVYALTYRHEMLPFGKVDANHAELIERILLGLADEWRAAYQDYQAGEALELVAWLHLAGQRYAYYADAAGRLDSDRWKAVEALAESAIAAGRRDLAVDVFRAADQPGMHRDHLHQRCYALTGVCIPNPEPHLRVVT